MPTILPFAKTRMAGEGIKPTPSKLSTEKGNVSQGAKAFPIAGPFVFVTSAAIFLLYFGWRPGLKAYHQAMLWFDAKALGVRRIIAVEDVDQNAVLTPGSVHERGWPLDLMQKVLGPPDYAVVDPTRRIPPLILLSKERVEKLEKSEEFRRVYEIRTRQARETAARVSKWIALQEDCVTCSVIGERDL